MTNDVYFHVWGCRGSRSVVPASSEIGNYTSCYSLSRGDTLCTFDAGRGLAVLGTLMRSDPRLTAVKRVHLLVTHAHMDHWEGLKDVEWFWRRGNGLEVTLYGTAETLAAIRAAFSPPSFVPLQVLAGNTVGAFREVELAASATLAFDGFEVRTFPLHHYSGGGDARRYLDTVGFLVSVGGASVGYLSDHEPVEKTTAVEAEMARQARLVLFDSHFQHCRDHAFGHGSQEHTAGIARAHPHALVLAGHHGPMFSDETLTAAGRQHGEALPNFALAREGDCYRWDKAGQRFVKL